MSRAVALVLAISAATLATAGADATRPLPRGIGGKPDLQGVWNFNSGVPLERPTSVGDRATFTIEEFQARRAAIRKGTVALATVAPLESAGLVFLDNPLFVADRRTSLITYPPSGRLPALAAGVKRPPLPEEVLELLGNPGGASSPALAALGAALAAGGAAKRDSFADFGTSERCLRGADVPLLPGVDDNYVRIVQGPEYVVLVTDVDRRVIAIDGQRAAASTPRTWSGTSHAHWDADALVVETTHFNGRTPSFAGIGKSRDKIVTERFTRVSESVLEYAATVVDPATFKDRLEISFPMARADAQIYEDACHEGNYSLRNALAAARAAESAAK